MHETIQLNGKGKERGTNTFARHLALCLVFLFFADIAAQMPVVLDALLFFFGIP